MATDCSAELLPIDAETDGWTHRLEVRRHMLHADLIILFVKQTNVA